MDLDETLHYSAKFKQKAWKNILNFFGYEWKISAANPTHELEGINPEKWPNIGLSPREFTTQLLKNLDLDLKNFNHAGITEGVHTEEQLLSFLEKEWSDRLISAAREMDVEEVPGAVGMVQKLYAEDYPMGVVTQAPTEYAEIILGKLGLTNAEKPYISAIVGGEMVSRPKPDPEGLVKATQLVWLNQLQLDYPIDKVPIEEYIYLTRNLVKPLAFIGDL